MLTAAMLEARRRRAPTYPLLRVAWRTSAGLELGEDRIAPTVRATPLGSITRISQPGGWDRIVYGSGIARAQVRTVETSVSVVDPRAELLDMLETYDPRGSSAAIDWVSPGLVEADWSPLFRGVVSDWERHGLYTALLLKTDDTCLRKPVPAGTILRTEWGSAEEGSVFGTFMHLVTGIQDSWQVTARGMVRAPNLRYDEDLGYWYLASVGQLVNVRRVFYDGQNQPSGWSVRNLVYGQNRITVIEIDAGFQPSKGVVVSFDCEGADENGLADGAALTGAPDTLRSIINEYGKRAAPLNAYRGDSELIEAASWDLGSAVFARNNIEAARTFGGEQEPETLADVIDSFHQAYPESRIDWTELGQLRFGVIDSDDVDPDGSELNLLKHNLTREREVPLQRGDRREVYTHVRMPFMYASGEQKFLQAIEAHDVEAIGRDSSGELEKNPLSYDNTWSPGRLTRDSELSPAPPDDPEIPS